SCMFEVTLKRKPVKPGPSKTGLSRGSDEMTLNESIPLYRDGRHYDALNGFLVADIPFYMEEARKAGGPVLELACGTGRLTIPIAQAGVEIVGLDLSPSMLSHACTKAKAAGVDIKFVEGDCRTFALGRKFA